VGKQVVDAAVRGGTMLLERLTGVGGLRPASDGTVGAPLELQLPPEPRSAGVARRALADACGQWGVDDLVDIATLAMSELVTNAIVHAGSPILVLAEYDAGNLTMAVADGNNQLPALLPPDDVREGGRGVAIVAQLGATWGVQSTVLGKIVWVNIRHERDIPRQRD
jgi:anti-sigma regulatory factor (Ser/Thr protein kinase)